MFQGFTTQCACGEKLVRRAIPQGEPRCDGCKRKRRKEYDRKRLKSKKIHTQ